METAVPSHRLLAILCADGVGYSALMAADDRAALQALDAARAVFRAGIEAEHGRVVDMAGDSVLAVFESVAAAVRAALAVQRALCAAPTGGDAARLAYRIGIHLGDVIAKADGSVYGDGVNIAARLQTLAQPGGVVVSQAVHGAVAGRVSASFSDLGEQEVKNIPHKVRAFATQDGVRTSYAAATPARLAARRWRPAQIASGTAAIAVVAAAVALGVRWHSGTTNSPGNPARTVRDAIVGKSIAVLPFESLVADRETERIADGIGDELIATLSGVPGLKVSARTSSFFFKGRQASPAEIAGRLGVEYVVSGTVRRDDSKLRIGVHLARAADGQLLWSRSYDRAANDVLAMQTDIARSVAANLQVRIGQAQLAGSGTGDPEALRLYWQGRQLLDARGNEMEALSLARSALARDPGFVRARLLEIEAEIASSRFSFGRRSDARLLRLIVESAELAGRFPTMFEAQAVHGLALRTAWRMDASAAARKRALDSGAATAAGAQLRVSLNAEAGRMTEALDALDHAIALDPLSDRALSIGAFLMLQAGRPEAALAYANRGLELVPGARYTLALKAAALARLGRDQEALAAASSLEGGAANTYFGITALALIGQREQLETSLRRIEGTGRDSFFQAFHLLLLGRHDAALDKVQVDEITPGDFFLRMQYEPTWDPVRADPRFVALLETLGVKEAHDRAQVWRARNPPQGPSAPAR